MTREIAALRTKIIEKEKTINEKNKEITTLKN